MIEYPLVTVIIPVFNVEPYLMQCVDSVINQTYKKLEIVLVDDGSQDKCPTICDGYAKKDHRIKVIHKTNGGLSDARNKGIQIAKGEYLSFVDSDDFIHNRMIEILMNPLIKDKDLKISACQSLSFNDGDHFEQNQTISQTETIDFNKYFSIPLWMTAWGKVYKAELFNSVIFPVGRIHEDEFTTYKVCYAAQKLSFTPSRLLFYRQREGSIMKTQCIKSAADARDGLKERIDFLYSKKEYAMYSKSLIEYCNNYCNYKKKKNYSKDLEPILAKWEKDLMNFSTKELNVKNKLHYFYMTRLTTIRNILNEILVKFQK